MKDLKRIEHAVWECKFHMVWCPKYRFRILKGDAGESVRDIIRQLCEWKKVELLEGNVQIGHIHLVLLFAPYAKSRPHLLNRHVRFRVCKEPFQNVTQRR